MSEWEGVKTTTIVSLQFFIGRKEAHITSIPEVPLEKKGHSPPQDVWPRGRFFRWISPRYRPGLATTLWKSVPLRVIFSFLEPGAREIDNKGDGGLLVERYTI